MKYNLNPYEVIIKRFVRLTNLLENSKEPMDFINKILKDEQEITLLKECCSKMRNSIYNIIKQLVIFVKVKENILPM